MTESIFEIEHRPGEEVVLRFKVPAFSIVPAAARSHFRTARKETLLVTSQLA